jgi:aspartyl-tRNA(Asn)/glutamyl-tRNA(Gln) amidotransferase subunit C
MSALWRHWELKLLAVGFAIALWLFVMTSEKSDLILSAPIEFKGVPAGLALAAERPETVDVQLHALRGNLARLAPDLAELDLADVQPTSHPLDLVNVWDEDEPHTSLPLADVLTNAPATDGALIRVPPIA